MANNTHKHDSFWVIASDKEGDYPWELIVGLDQATKYARQLFNEEFVSDTGYQVNVFQDEDGEPATHFDPVFWIKEENE